MNLSILGRSVIEFCEDFRDTAYPDQRGVLTIGYGHTGSDVIEGLTCNQDQADQWLRIDTVHAAVAVGQEVKVGLTQHQFDALVSFTFNVGVGAFSSSTLLKLLNIGQPLPAADEFLKWDRVNGQENAGLARRRRLERALFLDGI